MSGTRQVSLLHVTGLSTIPSPTTVKVPLSLLHATPQRPGQPTLVGLDFAIDRQARHLFRPNRVHLRYGLVVHLPLFPTPPRGDAVTFGYRPESVYLKRTFTSLTYHTYRHTCRPCRALKSGGIRRAAQGRVWPGPAGRRRGATCGLLLSVFDVRPGRPSPRPSPRGRGGRVARQAHTAP